MKALIFAGFFCAVGGVLIGMEIGWRQREAEPDKIVTIERTCQAPSFNARCAEEAAKYHKSCAKKLGRKWL